MNDLTKPTEVDPDYEAEMDNNNYEGEPLQN